MRETREGAADVLEKIAAFGNEEDVGESAPREPVHPHKTKTVAAENRRAFGALLSG